MDGNAHANNTANVSLDEGERADYNAPEWTSSTVAGTRPKCILL